MNYKIEWNWCVMRGSKLLTSILMLMIIINIFFSTIVKSQGGTVAVELYVIITDSPNGNDLDFTVLDVMGNITVYASAYYKENNSYAGLLEVNWTLSDPLLGSLSNTTGTSTTVIAEIAGGTLTINGTNDFLQISDETTLNIQPPIVDYIQIRSEPNGGGVDLSDPDYYPYYMVGETDTLWGAAYNGSIGYVGDVGPSSDWLSLNESNATVTSPGISSMLSCKFNETNVTVYLFDTLSGKIIYTVVRILATPPTVDRIIISSDPGDSGIWFDSGTFKEGDEITLYSAGYNDTFDFLGEVNVTWNSSNSTVGEVTPNGTSTTFTALREGTCFVFADYGSVINTTGVLTVVGVEEIKIRSAPNGGGHEIIDESFYIGEGTTFWAAGYAAPFGFLGDVSVTWACNNSNVGAVTTPGISSNFEAVGGGTCFVWAIYNGMTSDFTGTISVLTYDVDYIKILDFPGGLGGPVGDRSYDIGVSAVFYAAGYNSTAGYLGDVDVTWSLDDPTVGTVSSPGMLTIFETLQSGTSVITAGYGGGIQSITGSISVALIDEIRILEEPEEDSSPVDDREYNIGDEDTFWAVGYNITYGYVGVVNVTWNSSDPSIGNVSASGTSTNFNANGVGSCFITAEYVGGISNTTGTLTVIPFEVDFIKVLESPGGSGSPVTERSYDIGEIFSFFAAGFNFTGGYIGDVSVEWTTDSTDVGTVTSPGFSTTFEALGSGICFITADYGNGITANTGMIKVALVDEIRIKEAGEEGSPSINDRDYEVGDEDTFWAIGYNNTYGYLGIVDVTWTSSDLFVGSVDQFGSSTNFKSNWIGACFITATYTGGISNITGTLTVKLPSIITVDDDGNAHFTSIQEAIDYANPQDTIIVYQGIYSEPLIVDKPLTLMGEDNTGTIIDGDTDGTVIRVSSDDVDISGFTIQGGDYGIYCDESDYVLIEDNVISGSSEYGIFVTSCGSLSILNNSGTDSEIYLSDSIISELWIENTTLTNHDSTIQNLHLDDTSELLIVILLSIMVVDEKNDPVEGAAVFIMDTNDNIVSVHVTDANGMVRSINLVVTLQDAATITSYLPYRIVVEKESFETVILDMNSSRDNTIGISLKDETVIVKTSSPGFPWAMVLMVGFIGTLAVFGASTFLMEVLKFGLLSLFIPLFTRLKRKEILNQPIRERIYGYILGNPGANYGLIKHELSLPNGQLVYHLRQLTVAHLIYSRKDGIKKRFFPVEFPKPKGPIHYLTETQKNILKVVKKVSGISQKDIAKSVGITRQVAYYHLSKLEKKGLIKIEAQGTERRYYAIENPG
jgi:parallel beta-helix repeat protein